MKGEKNEEAEGRRGPPVLAYRLGWYERLDSGRYAFGTDLVQARTKEEARDRWERTRDTDRALSRRFFLSAEAV